ncbi:hypothetical protein [Tenacibaculum jejuense]|uniref:Lipoprotein n=1 Tax=Tenacibaculum jejuense TaxID=584609 RepID=A0A238U6F6_9FLAO|nr:hypothetical protein [Tenacibaculum jejuense]SNR14737.1 conserved protein of unknown function [Tenacibaculum jejuense]
MTRTYIIFLLLLIACKPEKKDDYYSEEKNEIEHIDFNLPTFRKWTECYADESVKLYFDELLISDKFKTLGVYLNNYTFSKKDSLDILDFEDYAVFMVNKNEQKWKLTGDDLERIFRVQKKKTGTINVDRLEALKKVYSDTTFLHSEKPIVIEEYRPNENILSALKLVKPFYDDHEIIVVYVYNLILINNHLVYGGYYLDLNGIESLEKAKEMNEVIMTKFLESNK